MAGHNKWSQIKHKKAKEDAKRGKQFTKLIKEIIVVAREGGGDPEMNAKLRQLVDKAKYINMPQDNITRAIKRGTGELAGAHYEAYTYEGYAPHGVAVMVDTLSDNKNRTVADMRHLFSKHGGSLGESGSVAWMFDHKGVIRGTGSMSEDDLLEALMEYDVSDIKKDDNLFSIYCDPKALDAVKKAAEKAGLNVESAQMEWVAKTPMELDENKADKVVEFLSIIDDHDDVQELYSNLA